MPLLLTLYEVGSCFRIIFSTLVWKGQGGWFSGLYSKTWQVLARFTLDLLLINRYYYWHLEIICFHEDFLFLSVSVGLLDWVIRITGKRTFSKSLISDFNPTYHSIGLLLFMVHLFFFRRIWLSVFTLAFDRTMFTVM